MGHRFPHRVGFLPPSPELPHVYQDPTNTGNYSEFCDPHADQLASQAQAAQLTDPAAARRLWAQVDRIVTDQAPWVPILIHQIRLRPDRKLPGVPLYGPLLDQMWVR